MKFLADENVSRVVIGRLRDAGFDVADIPFDRRGSRDEIVLRIAGAESRILVTEDRDFGELVIRKQLAVAGVLLLELDQLSNAAEADRVLQIVRDLREKLIGHLVVVEPARTRLRPLPVQSER